MSSGPAERSRRPPSPAFCRGRSKKNKNTLGVFLFLLWPRAGAQRGFSFPCLSPGPQQKKKKHTHPGWCFFLLWPRAGAQRGFSFPCHSPGPQQKKQITMGGVLFFALAPCRRPTGLLLPLPFPVAGAKKKQHPGWCFFLALAPCRRPTELLLPLPSAAVKKKHTPWVVFIFLLWPRAGAQRRFSFPCLSPGPEQKKNTLGFCSGPVPAPNGASPSPALPRGRSKKNTLAGCFFFILLWPRAGAQGRIKKKNTLGGVFFFCSGPVPAPNKASPSPAFPRGRSKKKKHPGWCFFFLLWPRAGAQGRSKKKHPGWCLFFALAPCRRPTKLLLPLPFPGAGAKKKKHTLGGVFFLLWPRAGAQRSFSFPCLSPGPEQKKNTLGGVFFFALAPCRRPRPEQKKTPCFFFCSGPVPAPNGASPSPAFPGGRSQKKKHPGWCIFFCSGPVPAPNGASPSLAFGRSKKKHTPWVVFIFLLWPRAGAQRRFSFPCLSPGPEQKKNTLGFCSGPVPAPNGASPSPAFPRGRSKEKHPGCFFYILLWPRAGAQGRIKKKTPWVVFFFCSGPVPAPNEASPSPAFPRGRSKKKNTLGGVFFFALAPCRRPRPEQKKSPWVVFIFCSGPVPAPNEASPSPAFPRGRSKKKKKNTPWVVFFFLLWPRAGAQRSFSFPCLSPGPEQKKKKHTLGGVCFFALAPCRRPRPEQKTTPWVVFFFCSGPVPAPNEASPSPASCPGAGAKKKNTLGGVFFFCSGPVPAPKAGAKKQNTLAGVFFFALAPCRRPTGLLLPLPFPGAGAKKKKQHPGWCFFFALAPPRRPTDFSFPCLSPGPEKKNNTLGGVFFFALAPCRRPRPEQKKTHPGWCFFFCSGPVPAPNGASPSPAFPRGRSKKKNTLGGVFFFALAPPRRPTERNKNKNTLHTRADSNKFSRNP